MNILHQRHRPYIRAGDRAYEKAHSPWLLHDSVKMIKVSRNLKQAKMRYTVGQAMTFSTEARVLMCTLEEPKRTSFICAVMISC